MNAPGFRKRALMATKRLFAVFAAAACLALPLRAPAQENMTSCGNSQYALVSAISFDASESGARGAGNSVSLELISPALSTDASVTPGVTFGVDYQAPAEIAYLPSSGLTVKSESVNYFMAAGDGDLQVQIVRETRTVRTETATTSASEQRDALIYKMKYAPDAVQFPWNGGVALGAALYVEGSTTFSQPFAALTAKSGPMDFTLGVNRLAGAVPHKTGVIASSRYALSPEFDVFADYDSVDFNKAAVNYLIVPRAGVDCSTCSKDALNLGVVYKSPTKQPVLISLGYYDVGDLKSLFTSLSINRRR